MPIWVRVRHLASLRVRTAIPAGLWIAAAGTVFVGTALVNAALVADVAAQADQRVVDAARAGDRATVLRLVRARADVNAPEADGTTALHWAARAADAELVLRLLRAGARPAAANRYGVTPLALAATNGHAGILRALIEGGAPVDAAGPDGETALMTAARTGQSDALRVLLDHGANPNARESWRGETALMWAAGENHPEAVRLLASRGADLDAASMVLDYPKVKVDFATMVGTALPRGGLTALMLAAREGAAQAIEALAASGANLDSTDPDGSTALVIAIVNAHYDAAAVLVDKGADLGVADAAGMAPLYAAVDMRHQEPLINRPLRQASGRLTALDLIDRLLARGADPNQRLKAPLLMRQHNGGDGSLGDGATPLMRAAKVSDVELMRRLLDKGVDANARMKNGTTAVMVAAGRPGRNPPPEATTIQAIALCLERGADVNAANDNGDTALHVAVGRGDDVVRMLADRGAKLDAKDAAGRTPLDVAMGVPGGGRGGRGRGGAPPARGPVRESTAALLKRLMGAP